MTAPELEPGQHQIYGCSEALVKHLWGNGASFSRRRKGGMVIIRGMVNAQMFYGRMVLFCGEWHFSASPFNSKLSIRGMVTLMRSLIPCV